MIVTEKDGELYAIRKNGEIRHYKMVEMTWRDYEKLHNVEIQ